MTTQVMRFKTLERIGIVTAAGLAILAVGFCEAQETLPPAAGADQTASADVQANVDVMTSGPVHEAFANPVALQAEEGLVISQAPPEPIDELPPEAMPEGENVEWIPGYWGWDEEQSDFIWVSGLWRNIPPDQRWVPGYWAQLDSGYRWVSGFWTVAESRNLDYLPYPPESQENGPNVPAPGEGYFWIPGSWVYTSGDYQWRPGYWAEAHDDWCWIPQRYVWTPRGALYSPGYWDYRLPYRGMLFAPVHFSDYGYYRGGRRFTPGYAINTAGLLVSLFVRPQYGHYYFGNYYGDEYYQRGYRPWFDASYGGHYHYDPLLAFYESYYDRRGVDFSGRVNQWFTFYERNPDRRPARTWQESVRRARQADGDATIRLAQPLDELVSGDGEFSREFRRLNEQQRRAFAQASSDFRELMDSRGRAEREAGEQRRGESRDAARPDLERPQDEERRGDRPRSERPEQRPQDREEQAQDRDEPARERDGRGLELPQFQQRGREILGEGRDRGRDIQERGAAGEDRRQQAPGQQRQRGDNAQRGTDDAQRGSEAGREQEGRRSREDARRPEGDRRFPAQPPQRPQYQPSDRDRQTPGARGERPQNNQARQQRREGADRQPARNIFQPRRGNFGEGRPEGIEGGRRPQIDPRDAVPQFRGQQGAAPNPSQRQGARQGQRRSGNPPAASPNQPNRGNANPGNRGNGNRGNRGNNRGGGDRE